MRPGRWNRSLAALLAVAALAAPVASPVRAAYPATVDSNVTAFSTTCIGINDTFPAKLQAAAVAGYRNLGYATTGFSGAGFTRAHVLSRTTADWGYYVHCHGARSDRVPRKRGDRRWTAARTAAGERGQSRRGMSWISPTPPATRSWPPARASAVRWA